MKLICKELLVILLLCSFIIVAFTGCGDEKQENVDDPVESTEPHQSNQTEQSEALMDIPTTYGMLRYPSQWVNYLKLVTVGDPTERIEFYAEFEGKEDMLVLTVHFNEDGEFPIGVLENSDESVYIAYTYGENDMSMLSSEECDIVYGMQEGINDIISELEKNSAFTVEEQ